MSNSWAVSIITALGTKFGTAVTVLLPTVFAILFIPAVAFFSYRAMLGAFNNDGDADESE